MNVPVFWIEETGQQWRYLRRFKHADEKGECPIHHYHDAMMRIESTELVLDADGYDRDPKEEPPHGDPRWPAQCDCGYLFQEGDRWQLFTQREYRRVDNGETMITREAPIGAMWDSWWLPDYWKGADGIALTVKLPGNHD